MKGIITQEFTDCWLLKDGTQAYRKTGDFAHSSSSSSSSSSANQVDDDTSDASYDSDYYDSLAELKYKKARKV